MRCVQQVERFDAQLHVSLAVCRQERDLLEIHINQMGPRPIEYIPATVAEGVKSRRGERRRVEPAARSGVVNSASGDAIRTA